MCFLVDKIGGVKMNKHKKLDIYDRINIQAGLAKNESFSKIAKRIGCNVSTISREINKNSYYKDGYILGKCKKTTKNNLCNGCKYTGTCTRPKKYYDFNIAQNKASEIKHKKGSFPKIDFSKILYVDKVVKDGVESKQSLHHIYESDSKIKKICSERTIRRWIYEGYLSVKPYDLRRFVTFKHEYAYIKRYKTHIIEELAGRTMKDYKKYKGDNPDLPVVQYDSVIGLQSDKKAILTITFIKQNLAIGRLIDKGNPDSVQAAIKDIFNKFTSEEIKRIFSINLCDNGIEFIRFSRIEFDDNGEQICKTFYTNAYRATDKAECERNHEIVRYILPKRQSFDKLTQEIINEVFSNINSYVRSSKGNKTPYELFEQKHGKVILDKLGIRKIKRKKVRLNSII